VALCQLVPLLPGVRLRKVRKRGWGGE
jgi:hypothetical protein